MTDVVDRDDLLAEAGAIAVSNDNVQDLLQRYIDGATSNAEMVALFQFLVDTGRAWTLHPILQSAARYIVESGLVTEKGQSE